MSQRRHRRDRDSGFTLIELLVSISIIAILIAMLLPALTSARQMARTIRCATQIRQIQFALLSYAQDNDGRLPYAERAPSQIWSSVLVHQGYLTSPAFFWCDERDMTWGPNAAQTPISGQFGYMMQAPNSGIWSYVGYAVSRYGAMPRAADSGHQPLQIDAVRVPPSRLLTMTEAYAPGQGAQTGARGGWYWITPHSGSTAVLLFTHAGNANTAFLDGHVETRTSDSLGFSYENQAWQLPWGTTNDPWFHGTARINP